MRLFTQALVLILISTSPFAFSQTANMGQSRGNSFNPDISIVGSFLYRNSSRGNDSADPESNGFRLEETELRFAADVDPYLRANTVFSVHRESGEWVIEPEEAYVETLGLAVATLKAGKFKTAFGKYNTVHAHAMPFIDQQLVGSALLGEEGSNGEGLSAAFLIPAQWYSELTLQMLSATADPFKSSSPNGNFAVLRFTNLWDLTDDLTFEWGMSGADGPNNVRKHTTLYGSDLTFKWRPSQGGKYSALIWSTEYMGGASNLNTDGTDNIEGLRTQGGYSFVQWQVAQRWWVQARTEYVSRRDRTTDGQDIQRKNSVLVGLYPTEFSAFRLQYDHLVDSLEKSEDRIMLQMNVSIGAHPAHGY